MPQSDDESRKSPKKRKSITSLSSKRLYQEVDNRCPFCGVGDVAVLEIHHIDGDPSNSKIGNLIVVCGNCHSNITRGEISQAAVYAMKVDLLSTRKSRTNHANNTPIQSVKVKATNVSDSIIANTVNMGPKRPLRIQYSADSIGADTIKKGYVDYLIKRYFEYRKADASYGRSHPFNYPEIHRTIQSKFKAKTFFIHVSRFEELCDYIKNRVNRTIQGGRNRSHGIPNYDSFEEYEEEQLGHN